jgi:hypothetical protein
LRSAARNVDLGSAVAAETVAAARTARSSKGRLKAQNLDFGLVANTEAILRDTARGGVNNLSGIARALEVRGTQTPRGDTLQVVRVSGMAAKQLIAMLRVVYRS